MSQSTTFLQIPYPEEYADPFMDDYNAQMQAIDEIGFMAKIQANLMIGGGGTISLNPASNVLSWTAPFVLPVFHYGKLITVSFGSNGTTRACSLPDGAALVLEIPYVLTGSVDLTFSSLSQLTPLNHQQWVAGFRSGTKVYLKGIGVVG